jgi:hypothetical protein
MSGGSVVEAVEIVVDEDVGVVEDVVEALGVT